MARNRISTIIHHQLLFFTLFFSATSSCLLMPYSLGLEFNYEGDWHQKSILSASLLAAYETGPLSIQAQLISDEKKLHSVVKILPNPYFNKTKEDEFFAQGIADASELGIELGMYFASSLKRKYFYDKNVLALQKTLFLEKQKENRKLAQQKELYYV